MYLEEPSEVFGEDKLSSSLGGRYQSNGNGLLKGEYSWSDSYSGITVRKKAQGP